MVSGVFSIPLEAPGGASKSTGSKNRAARPPLREFVGGEENLLAKVAAQSLAADPEFYNPLLFVGPTGVGKSHLAHGLVERWKQARRERKTLATTGADFARAYAEAVDTDSLADLREKYLAVDLLLLDDLHEMTGKRAAQEELIHLLDALLAVGKRVVATCRQLPTEVPGILDALASRLSSGLCVPLAAPGSLARRAILVKLAALHEAPLADATLDLLVERLAGTVPQLNHVVVELEQTGRHAKQDLDHEAVADFLADQPGQLRPNIRTITAVTAKYFRLKTAELKGPSRRTSVVHARSMAMYLARRLTDESLDQVGEQFGGRDHTTVLHACRKIESLVEKDAETKHIVEELLHQISTTPKQA